MNTTMNNRIIVTGLSPELLKQIEGYSSATSISKSAVVKLAVAKMFSEGKL